MNENKWKVVGLVASILIVFVGVTLAALLVDDKESEPVFRTNAEFVTYTNELLDINCEGENLIFQSTIGLGEVLGADEFGYVGSQITTVDWRDVADSTSAGGDILFSVMIDPNNGHIYKQVCNYRAIPEDCPKDASGEYIQIQLLSMADNPWFEEYVKLDNGKEDSDIVGYAEIAECLRILDE